MIAPVRPASTLRWSANTVASMCKFNGRNSLQTDSESREDFDGGALARADRAVHVAGPFGGVVGAGEVQHADRLGSLPSERCEHPGRIEAAVRAARVGVASPDVVHVAARTRSRRAEV